MIVEQAETHLRVVVPIEGEEFIKGAFCLFVMYNDITMHSAI
jgi:hypothetical protein